MRISNPKDVQFLALEGGGGKGFAYLGAIEALEELGILPIRLSQPSRNQIKGISGASAGAITGLMLAMGKTGKAIEEILNKTQTFNSFFDDPLPNVFRSVGPLNEPTRYQKGLEHTSSFAFAKLAVMLSGMGGVFDLAAALGLFGDSAIVQKFSQQPLRYVYNLLFDHGLFPGFAVRNFLVALISDSLRQSVSAGKTQLDDNAKYANWQLGYMSFELFNRITGVDFVVTGTNVTKKRPFVFSVNNTPHFPVAEAVAISMNVPLIFKPIHVQVLVPDPPGQKRKWSDQYQGFWLDGGILNNFPLHAFDHLQSAERQTSLHPAMLGLRLSPPASNTSVSKGYASLMEFLGALAETVLYPSELGQIRTADEEMQTIEICTYDLSLLEFSPPSNVRAKPRAEARKAVLHYFGRADKPVPCAKAS